MICMHPYLMWNIGPPLWWSIVIGCLCLHSQSFICPSHILTHSCASHPLSCKCSAHPGLSSTVTALAVYQAWLCPQVWCCLIHHEDLNRSFILCIILRIVIALIVRVFCQHPSRGFLVFNLLLDCQSVMNLPPSWNNTLQSIISLHGTVKSSRHGSHTLQ